MHISHSGEDDNLKRLLSFSISAIRSKCGHFDIKGTTDIDNRARELALERARYSYNDAVEYFDENFLSDINGLAIDIALQEGEVDEGV